MKKLAFFIVLSAFTACNKAPVYHCQCTITTAVGSGTYIGSSSVRAKAEADCSDKIAEVQADGQTASCDVKENVD